MTRYDAGDSSSARARRGSGAPAALGSVRQLLAWSIVVGALLAVSFLPADATAQDAPQKPRIVVVVMPSGDVPPGIPRDIQDLFLTALAEHEEYDLVDREMVYETTPLEGDVDLLLCVTHPECITRLHREHDFEHYVIVKVVELDEELEFTYSTFNHQNRSPIVFGDRYRVAIDDHAEFVNRAFAVAEGLELESLGTGDEEGDPCADVVCDDGQVCRAGVCEDDADGPPEIADDGPGVEWRLPTGIAVGTVGVGLTVTSIVLYALREGEIDDLAGSYQASGPRRISSMEQGAAAESVDTINTYGTVAPILLGVGLATAVAGGGLLTWYFLDEPTDAAPPTAGADATREPSLSLRPRIGPDQLGMGARIDF